MNFESSQSQVEKPTDLKIKRGLEGFIVMEGTIDGHQINLGKFEYGGGQRRSDFQGTIDGHKLESHDAEVIWQKYQGGAENLLVEKPDPEAKRLVGEIL